MSIHKSLAVSANLQRYRNVLNRAERLELLQKKELWKEGDSVFGLRKVAPTFKLKKAKAAEKKEEKKE